MIFIYYFHDTRNNILNPYRINNVLYGRKRNKMNKYLYFAVVIPINEIIKIEGDITEDDFNFAIATMCRKNFEIVYDSFLEAVEENDAEGFVGRINLDSSGFPTGSFKIISKSEKCLNLDDCLQVKFGRKNENSIKILAKAELNEYGKSHVLDIIKNIVCEKRHTGNQKQPLEICNSTLAELEDSLEKSCDCQIVDEKFYMHSIELTLSNNDKVLIHQSGEGEYTWDKYNESYWFKNKERIISEYEPNFSISD